MDLRLAFATVSILPALASSATVAQSGGRVFEEPPARLAASEVPVRCFVLAPVSKTFRWTTFSTLTERRGFTFAFRTLDLDNPAMRAVDEKVAAEAFLASRKRVPRWAAPYTRRKWYFALDEAAKAEPVVELGTGVAPVLEVSAGVAGPARDASGRRERFVQVVREAP